MNKEWVDKKNGERQEKIIAMKKYIADEINACRFLGVDEKKEYLKKLDSAVQYLWLDLYFLYLDKDFDNEAELEKCKEWGRSLPVKELGYLLEYPNYYDEFLDSELVEFDGDIIITDPCYIIKDGSDDWERCNYGENMELLGFSKYITKRTLCGDWSCTTYNTDNNQAIGAFSADTGLVSVFLLDEILKYNPEYKAHIESKWTTTWIRDFKGKVQIIVTHSEGVYSETTEYHSEGDTWEDFSVEVVGHGVNKITGQPINFIGCQTGF